MLGNLGSHDITVIALGYRYEDISFFNARFYQTCLVKAVADQSRAAEVSGQAAEAVGIGIQNGNLMPLSVQQCGQLSADPSRAHNHYFHMANLLCGVLVVEYNRAGGVFQNIGCHVAQTELTEAFLVLNPHQDEVYPSFHGLIDNR